MAYGSKDCSPVYHSADEEGDGDLRKARRIPLPESPIKGQSPRTSPEPVVECEGNVDEQEGASTLREEDDVDEELESPTARTPTQNNCE